MSDALIPLLAQGSLSLLLLVARPITLLLRLPLRLLCHRLSKCKTSTFPVGSPDLRLLNLQNLFNNDASDLLTKELRRVMQWIFHLSISESIGGFAGTTTNLARQLRDLMEATAPNANTHAVQPGLIGLNSSIPLYVPTTMIPHMVLLVLELSILLFISTSPSRRRLVGLSTRSHGSAGDSRVQDFP